MAEDRLDKVLHKVPVSRRAAIKGVIATTAFVVPMIASFPMDGRLTISRAMAQQAS
jgi:hypothetical protein